jgi:DNA (cytosine-5)-methyltransferase 1
MIRVLEAFSGMGAQHKALKRIGIDYEIVGTLEINPTAIKAYQTIHGTGIKNFGDICKIDPIDIPEFDFMSYSFPCQSISSSGKREGFTKGSGTKSSLLWEVEKIISHHKPKYLLLENVQAILSDKYKKDFEEWKNVLKGYGYNNYVYLLNAADFGVPQSRKRCFMVSILKEHDYGYADSDVIEEDNFNLHYKKKKPTLKDIMEQGTIEDYYYKIPDNLRHRGEKPARYFKEHQVIGTLTTRMYQAWNCGFIIDQKGDRYVTPLEAIRLMGFDDSDYTKLVEAGMSRNQITKLCGNSIVVNVLEVIFAQLFRKEF